MPMRFINVYLIVYFVLVAAALVALWSGGALGQVPAGWTILALAIAIGFGVLLAVTTGRRVVTDE
ncbi:MAG: hypothetical protein ACRD1V_05640 [Vicinamibacterales bacterium]